MKIYVDTCCYGRPYDDLTIPNTKAEALAVHGVINVCKVAGIAILGSPAVVDEINSIPDDDKDTRGLVREFYNRTVTGYIPSSADRVLRAREFMAAKMKEYDSYHLAYAEGAGMDFLLSTDRKFINKAARLCAAVKVVNPVNMLAEVKKWARWR